MSFARRIVFAAVAVSALSVASHSHAETIFGALGKAYQFNSELNSARAGVRVTDEGVAIAKSGYRPQVVATSSLNYVSQSGVQLTTGSFGVAISQTLFDGFQTKNNVRAAEAQVRASNEGLRNTEQNILFNAASAYMDVIRDRQIAALTERNVKSLAEQLRAARSRFDVGEGTRTDVAQADAARSAAVAQASSARAQAASSEAVYRQIVGENPGKLKSAGPVKGLPKSLEAAYAQAAGEHPAIQANLYLVDASAFSVKSAEGALMPQLSAQVGLSRDYTSGSPVAANNGWDKSASIGATLRVPIYQGGQVSATVRQRKESLGQARIEVDVTRDSVRAAVASAWSQYHAAVEGVQANRDLVAAAQLALNGVVEERNVGQRTTLDVLNAQADVISAQINQVGTERDLVVASYAILSAIGRLNVGRLGLQVAQYKPEEHYNAVKDKWFGLRTPDGR
jgi:outer membrane protein